MRRLLALATFAISPLAGGCARLPAAPALPQQQSMVLDQLIIHSNSALPEDHRLLGELRQQRAVMSGKLGLGVSDEPIDVYLFPTADQLDAYVRAHFPELPQRRALFVETDTRLSVYAYWGDRVAEDLRHEVAHGYLHALVPGLPLWVDEGLAEYFEVPRGMAGVNRPHVEQLIAELNRGWQPNLTRLDALHEAGELAQLDYAESWAWIHFLLETTPERRQLLHGYLQSLTGTTPVEPLSARVRAAAGPEPIEKQLADHVLLLKQQLQ
ncbi:MAG: DUF1570 domain-containing protein [Pirellulales bacterium]